jgi:hypothetical protein
MELTEKLLSELQRRLKIGNRRCSLKCYSGKFKIQVRFKQTSHIDPDLPNNFIKSLLTELPLKFRISWKRQCAGFKLFFKKTNTIG